MTTSAIAAFVWCSECNDDGDWLAQVVVTDRGLVMLRRPPSWWLWRTNEQGGLLRRQMHASRLTRIWQRGRPFVVELTCRRHGQRTLDLMTIEQPIRQRTSATRPARIVV